MCDEIQAHDAHQTMPDAVSPPSEQIEVMPPPEPDHAHDEVSAQSIEAPEVAPQPDPAAFESFDVSQTLTMPAAEMDASAHAEHALDAAPAEHMEHAYTGEAQAGDLPFYSVGASGHQDAEHGQPINTFKMDSIAGTLGLPGIGDFISKLDSLGGYNAGQSDDQKVAGAYLAMNTAAKFAVMPPGNFADEYQAGDVYAQLKSAALAGDAGTIRDLLTQNGGDPRGLNDQQLIDLWAVNEHQNLHAVLFGNPDIYNAVHVTSLNDHDESGVGHLRGGYNDKGQWPQWGWFEAAKTFNEKFIG